MVEARPRYERMMSALVGQRILGVTYWDVHNFGDGPRTWDYGDWGSRRDGRRTGDRSWSGVGRVDGHLFPYGIEVFPEPISNHLGPGPEDPEGWPVETHDHWRSRVGSPVLGTAIFWERIDVGPARRSSDNVILGTAESYQVPVALRLDFEAGPLWMVAGMPQWPDVEKVFVPADEIMVLFSPERMRTIGFPETGFLGAEVQQLPPP